MNLQTEIGTWARKTFGRVQVGPGLLNHLRREVEELIRDGLPEEAADCAILLFDYAHMKGFDLIDEVKKKMEINYKRTWGKPDADGVIEHIEEADHERANPVDTDPGNSGADGG